MSQMINDLLQNIYSRIAEMGKSITSLQQSIDVVNKNLDTKIQKVVGTIEKMSDDVKKEGVSFEKILRNASDKFQTEIKKLQSNIGISDLEELTTKLKQIARAAEETLKTETVDVLLSEVLEGIKSLAFVPDILKTEKSEKDQEKNSGKEDKKGVPGGLSPLPDKKK
jgi:Skp family chaperone for outer membrane proteins